MKFTITINPAGRVVNINAFIKFLSQLKPGDYWLEPQSVNKRSTPQNNWLHSILPDVKEALRNAGYDDIRTENDAKNFLKSMFFKKTITNGLEFVEIVEGTSETSKEVFTERAEAIIKWAAEYMGINIAPPEKQLEIYD